MRPDTHLPGFFNPHVRNPKLLSIAGYIRHLHPVGRRAHTPVGAASTHSQHLRVRSNVPSGVHTAHCGECRSYCGDAQSCLLQRVSGR